MMNKVTNISAEGGLFTTRTVSWDGYEIETPVKTIPAKNLTSKDQIDSEIRHIAQAGVELEPADLEAYRSGKQPQAIQNLQKKLANTVDTEVQVAIFEYTDGHEINQLDMDTLVEIQNEYADIITMPCQPGLSEPLMDMIDDGRSNLNNSPFRALRSGVENCKEALSRKELDKPVMGVLPLLSPGHRRQILKIYEDIDIDFLAIDFRGLKPTKDTVYDWLEEFVADLTVRGEFESHILYALNYRKCFPKRNSDLHPSEGITLVCSGFDVLGETHVSRRVIDGDYEPSNTKAFDGSSLGYKDIPLDNMQDEWPHGSTISGSQLDNAGTGKRRKLRQLANAEWLNYSLRAFRAAIDNGEVRQFIENKDTPSLIDERIQAMEQMYKKARGPSITGD
jgi:hypothetical protein